MESHNTISRLTRIQLKNTELLVATLNTSTFENAPSTRASNADR